MTAQVPQVFAQPVEPSILTMEDGTLQGAAEELVIESTLNTAGEAAFQAAGEVKAALVSETSAGLIGHGLHILAAALTHVM